MRAKRDVKTWLVDKCVDNDSDALIMIGYLKGKYNYRDVWAINVIKDRTVAGANFFQPITINELATYTDPHGIDFALSGLPSGYIGVSNVYDEIKSLRKEIAELRAAKVAPAISRCDRCESLEDIIFILLKNSACLSTEEFARRSTLRIPENWPTKSRDARECHI